MELLTYINSNDSPTLEKYQSVKNRLKSILGNREPDMDLSDNSVVGDLILNRFAKVLALAEEAQDCIFSDIQLSNILNGNICDCDFATEFVKSLGFDSLLQSNTMGVLRIRFKASELSNFASTYEDDNITLSNVFALDAGTSIGFNNEYMFRLFAPQDGPVYIKFPDTSSLLDTTNTLVVPNKNFYYAGIDSVNYLNGAYQPESYFVDIPIYGPSDANVSAGDEATTDINTVILNNFILEGGITSVTDISPFETPTSLVDLTKLAQKIYPSANFSTKSGIVSYLTQKFTNIDCFVPLTNNDSAGRQEQITVGNTTPPTQVTKSTLDIYTKSGTNLITVTQIVPKAYMQNIALMAPLKELLAASYAIQSTSDTNTYTTNSLGTVPNASSGFVDLTVVMGDGISDGGMRDLGGKNAKFVIANIFSNGYGTESTPQVPLSLSSSQDFYLTITYTYDPALMFVGNLINSPQCNPFCDTESRFFINTSINALNCNYTKQTNTYLDRQSAQESIYELMNNICYPLVYNDAYISDILISNGAYSINNIACMAYVNLCAYTTWMYRTQNSIYGGKINSNYIDELNGINGTISFSTTDTSSLPVNLSGETSIIFNDSNIAFTLPLENINLIENATVL